MCLKNSLLDHPLSDIRPVAPGVAPSSSFGSILFPGKFMKWGTEAPVAFPYPLDLPAVTAGG